jgi:hypothetical protein
VSVVFAIVCAMHCWPPDGVTVMQLFSGLHTCICLLAYVGALTKLGDSSWVWQVSGRQMLAELLQVTAYTTRQLLLRQRSAC